MLLRKKSNNWKLSLLYILYQSIEYIDLFLYFSPILCQDPKCSSCKMDLDIPCIHFFCEHSFHEQLVWNKRLICNEFYFLLFSCASAVESTTSAEIIYECPLCSGDNR